MEITNRLVEESLSWQYSGSPISVRQDDLEELTKVALYCYQINEKIQFMETLWNTEIEEECTLIDIVYGCKNAMSKDVSDMLRELITKRCQQMDKDVNSILCSCGKYTDAADNMSEYLSKRQNYLKLCVNHKEFGEFMESCFPNCRFAEGYREELKYIEDFEMSREEIVKCLALLDSRALELYKKHRHNLIEAARILQADMERTCALTDPKHRKSLQFTFSYEEENDEKRKIIECQPHFKLVRDDSNLRVYFYWQDTKISNGEKVLIGRVGRHPY